ncbi:MAG: hypothetical protein VW554_01670, partial [Alphaproteobacteria bacterium]
MTRLDDDVRQNLGRPKHAREWSPSFPVLFFQAFDGLALPALRSLSQNDRALALKFSPNIVDCKWGRARKPGRGRPNTRNGKG